MVNLDEFIRLADDPGYRTGAIMGRTGCAEDVMELILADNGLDAVGKLVSLLEWCGQTYAEGEAELALVAAEFGSSEGFET